MTLKSSNEDFHLNCSSKCSNDRLLTNSLLESSDIPFKCSKQFSHCPHWADGIDLWSLTSPLTSASSSSIQMKKESTRCHYDFHCDLGLYLPRHEKPLSAPLTTKYHSDCSTTKVLTKDFKPERIRILLRKEKDFLQSTNKNSTDENRLHSPTVPMNTNRSMFYQQNQDEHQQDKNDKLKNLLKEHLTEMLTRGSTFLQRERFDDQQQQQQQINENPLNRKDLSSQCLSSSTKNLSKMFEEKTSFGFRVSQIDLNGQKHFQSISLEKMAQQRNSQQDLRRLSRSSRSSSSSTTTSSPSSSKTSRSSSPNSNNLTRPSTQPLNSQQQQQSTTMTMLNNLPSSLVRRNASNLNGSTRMMNQSKSIYSNPLRRKEMFNNETTSTSKDLFVIGDSQTQQYSLTDNSKKNPLVSSTPHRHSHRSSKGPSNCPMTTTTIDLLPPIIAGKRLHLPAANHRYL